MAIQAGDERRSFSVLLDLMHVGAVTFGRPCIEHHFELLLLSLVIDLADGSQLETAG